jgi:hypothetical protein
MRTPEGSVILWVTPTDTTLPRSMMKVSQSFFSLLQKNVLTGHAVFPALLHGQVSERKIRTSRKPRSIERKIGKSCCKQP